MDLPTCPACKQSVLDDDAVDCPFGGAPMKGGAAPARPTPAAKSPAAKSAPDKSPPSKGGTGSAAPGKSSPAGTRSEKSGDSTPAVPTEDDPFGIDPTVAA